MALFDSDKMISGEAFEGKFGLDNFDVKHYFSTRTNERIIEIVISTHHVIFV
jgi:hypothetical protein